MRTRLKGFDKLTKDLNQIAKFVANNKVELLLEPATELSLSVKKQILTKGLIDTKTLLHSVHIRVSGETVEVVEGPLAYVLAQEYGLFNQKITPRQRGFFWYSYKQSGDEMWKALALSDTYSIPATPHFRPGITMGRAKAGLTSVKSGEILIRKSL